MFKALFGQKSDNLDAHALYGAVVARSRDAEFFEKFSVPDTFDGRFEMLVMHLFLLHGRLKDENKRVRNVSQLVFDNFIDDMDAALREAGVGDQTVPKRIAKMTQVFYGRTGAYENALEQEDQVKATAEVIARNLFTDLDPNGADERLAAYFVEQHARLRETEAETVVKDRQLFTHFSASGASL